MGLDSAKVAIFAAHTSAFTLFEPFCIKFGWVRKK